MRRVQQRLVPDVEEVQVERIEKEHGVFRLDLAAGGSFRARKVVVAAGLENAAYIPPEIAGLPASLQSHVSAHHDLSCFRGKDVTVIGAGQSALETAALLRTGSLCTGAGSRPRGCLEFASLPGKPLALSASRTPASGLGSGLQLWAYSTAPSAFRYLPQPIRFDRALRVLGPAGGWWLRERVDGKVPILLEHVVIRSEVQKDRAVLHIRQPNGEPLQIATDYVIAATGYRFALDPRYFSAPRSSRVSTRNAGRRRSLRILSPRRPASTLRVSPARLPLGLP